MSTDPTNPYSTSYAIAGFGGFQIDQSFPTYRPAVDTSRVYNVADAIQLTYSVRELNYKIGVVLDASENPTSGNVTINESMEITTDDFLNNVTTSNIVSMGKMSTLYSDFLHTINAYFGTPIRLNNNIFTLNGGVFDASAYLHLINGGNFDINGSFVSDFTGDLRIYDISTQLNGAISQDIFDNRSDRTYTTSDGYRPGDLIYIPEGMTVTLKLDIELGANSDIFSGTSNLQKIDSQLNYYDLNTKVRKVTTYSSTNITQSYTVPILLIASANEGYSFENYADTWTNMTLNLGARDWNFVSISSTGQYQSAIDVTGAIYNSNDFGSTWEIRYAIGTSTVNAIGITHEGQHQTASNGNEIYVSNDYGITWTKALDTQDVIIYISISLNGQYQKVVVAGDSLYSSDDFGVTWNRLDDGSNLFYSIQAFPTCGVSISYNGQYQVIVCETIYISDDFGVTFTDVFETLPFSDKNWMDVSISSDGQYMVAVESLGKVYLSNDYGATWNMITDTLLNIVGYWRNVSISGTGRYMSLLQDNGFIYFSVDYGVTWERNEDPALQNRAWRCIAVSANGHYQTAVEHDGYIYVSNLL